MAGVTDLEQLLAVMKPVLGAGEFVFCSLPADGWSRCAELGAVAACQETEGLSAVLPRAAAERAGLEFDGVFRCISLGVHSSLEAVGLTACVAAALADVGISANVVAGRYHDHLFVPSARAQEALSALIGVSP